LAGSKRTTVVEVGGQNRQRRQPPPRGWVAARFKETGTLKEGVGPSRVPEPRRGR